MGYFGSMKRLCFAVLMTVGLIAGTAGCASQNQGQNQPDVSASPSTACSPAKAAKSGLTTETLSVGNQQRTYMINIPPAYTGGSPTPLVLSMHGRGSNAQQQLALTGFDQESNQQDFILVAPNAIDGEWQLPATPAAQTSDTQFMTSLFDALTTRLCVDTTRMYATGMSLGSAMTFAFACSAHRAFAAFGGVGAAFYRPVCNQAPPAPIIYFHGGKDPIVPINGGKVNSGPRNGLTSRVQPAMDSMTEWATHNGCSATPQTTQIKTTELFAWKQGCKNNAVVDFYRSADAGHTWPGASELVASFIESTLGKTTQDVSATKLMWQFFQQYQLSPASNG